MAVLEDSDAIRDLRATLEASKEPHRWLDTADQAEADLVLVKRLMVAIIAAPGLIQSGLKQHLGLANASRASQLIGWLENRQRIYDDFAVVAEVSCAGFGGQ